MAITLASFLTKFSEFAALDPIKVQDTVEQTIIETDTYSGLPATTAVKEHATCLHIAHSLEVYRLSTLTPGGKAIEIKTKHDTVKYQPTADLFDFESTTYGKRLEDLLAKYPVFLNYC
ncbi:hypothetical protein [Myxosarcina sp. GI1(2024)]